MSSEPNDPTRSGPPLGAQPDSVTLSRNEVETLAMKAARGAGMSWGLAEEAGRATGWLQAQGIDGTAALLSQLDAADHLPWSDVRPVLAPGRWTPEGKGPLCPIAVGAALSDLAGQAAEVLGAEGLFIGPVGHPVLVLPFLAEFGDWPVSVRWSGGEVLVGSTGMAGEVMRLAAVDAADLTLRAVSSEISVPPSSLMACDGGTIARLNTYAMRTTVPASEKSRTDAGSAASDND